MVWSVTSRTSVQVVRQAMLARSPGAIARTNEHFKFPAGPAVMMLDCDGLPQGMPPFATPEAFRTALLQVCPELSEAPMIVRPSSSAGVICSNGQDLTKAGRWRAYIIATDGRDIPAAGARLFLLSWAAQYGFAFVSKAGRILLRSIVDGSVWQPERLDFTAPPMLSPGLIRRPAPTLVYNEAAPPFDLARISVPPELASLARIMQAAATKGAEAEAARVRGEWAAARAPAVAARTGRPVDEERDRLSRASERLELPADYPLEFHDGSVRTVAEVLVDRASYHGKRLADPIEPDYGNDSRIAVLYTDAEIPHVYSHAHGGTRYTFAPDAVAQVLFGSTPMPHVAPVAPSCVAVPDVAPSTTPVQPYSLPGTIRGALPATLEGVVEALHTPASGVRVAFDTFLDVQLIGGPDGAWRAVTDGDMARLRAEFGRRGFRPISAEIMRSALMIVAEENRFDSAQQWLNGLRWDGAPRIEDALSVYFGVESTQYTRAVAAYLFTAAAGRVLTPGVQADMAIVLTGGQGARKTSALRSLCPTPEAFREADLHKLNRKDEELARGFRGALVIELAELRGLASRGAESIKAWVSRRVERWRPVYREFETSYPRRAVLIGTTNADEFLDDATGERRWLPVRVVGKVDIDNLSRDRDQLWAEGADRYRRHGIAWQESERLAAIEHAAFKVQDPWQGQVAAWLTSPPPLPPGVGPSTSGTRRGDLPFTVDQILTEAIGLPVRDQTMRESHRVGKVLRAMGYEKQQRWLDGRNVKAWIRSPASPARGRQG